MLGDYLRVSLLAGGIAGAFPAITKLQELHPDDLTSEFHAKGCLNRLAQQRAVPDPLLGELRLHKVFNFRLDARLLPGRFAINESLDPELLKPIEIIMDALQVASKMLGQLWRTPTGVIQPDDTKRLSTESS